MPFITSIPQNRDLGIRPHGKPLGLKLKSMPVEGLGFRLTADQGRAHHSNHAECTATVTVAIIFSREPNLKA